MNIPRIIAIDDNQTNIILLEKLLNPRYQIIGFTNSIKAWEYIQKNSIDIILADMVMPCMSGLDLLKKVKEIHPGIPFIIISAYDKKKYIHEAHKLGAYRYLVKPFNPLEFIDFIEETIRRNIPGTPSG